MTHYFADEIKNLLHGWTLTDDIAETVFLILAGCGVGGRKRNGFHGGGRHNQYVHLF
jgi:hypothetical protein